VSGPAAGAAVASPRERFLAGVQPPPGTHRVPRLTASGWQDLDAQTPYLACVAEGEVNWSTELEELHEEASRHHFIDVLTRAALVDAVRTAPPADGVVLDVGCSGGYLLADLRDALPQALLVGADLLPDGLRRAHAEVPGAALFQADARALPFDDETVHAVVSANTLEHVHDHARALAEIRRVLVPGGRAGIVVPAGPELYDAYDAYLGHVRRYARGELAAVARSAGLDVVDDRFLGTLVYPPFWAVKRYSRRRERGLDAAGARARVQRDIAATQASRAGHWLCALEQRLHRRGIRLPRGVRGLTVVQRPRGAP
jgi:SAM-dependent methyltransferase